MTTKTEPCSSSRITCKCDNKNCHQEMWFDTESGALWHKGKDGQEHLMYLDANACLKLINGLKEVIKFMISK